MASLERFRRDIVILLRYGEGEISFQSHNLFIDYQFFADIFPLSGILQRLFYIPVGGRIVCFIMKD